MKDYELIGENAIDYQEELVKELNREFVNQLHNIVHQVVGDNPSEELLASIEVIRTDKLSYDVMVDGYLLASLRIENNNGKISVITEPFNI